MRAVWSFWSRPRNVKRGHAWLAERFHLFSWALSLQTARRHYPSTALVTDSEGARMLVDGLGLEFASVSTSLDALEGSDPSMWALGKLYAYRQQTEPFVHVDSDVYLWSPLPERIRTAPVFTQNPEPLNEDTFFYRPQLVENAMLSPPGGWVPAEWSWFLRSGIKLRGECCGIFGGCDLDFIRHYAEQAITLVEHPENRRRWLELPYRELDMISVEQYLLAACLEHHARTPGSRFTGVRVEHLFESVYHAYTPGSAVEAGYTHLIAGVKGEAPVMARLEARMARDYPAAYERCLRYARDHGLEPGAEPIGRAA
ncbi:MAG TPA: DUF6734 family protein [Longimicrobium sp.]|nr:DUF6734 family protein [Longimicrobium sp.]